MGMGGIRSQSPPYTHKKESPRVGRHEEFFFQMQGSVEDAPTIPKGQVNYRCSGLPPKP